jgi:hypothetical protein
MALRTYLDTGEPLKIFDDEKLSSEIEGMVKLTAAQISMAAMKLGLNQPTLTIS